MTSTRRKAHFDRQGVAAAWATVPFQGRTLHVARQRRDAARILRPHADAAARRRRRSTRTAARARCAWITTRCWRRMCAAAAKFYADLGFRVSDYICVDGDRAAGRGLHVPQGQSARHGVAGSASGPRYHHCGYIDPGIPPHGAGAATSPAISASAMPSSTVPGRHGLGHSYYTYLRDPDGHRARTAAAGGRR